MALHDAAVKLQTRWRSRAGRKLLLALRRGHRREAVKAQYVAERSTDHMTPLWERERQREREEMESYEREQAQLARLEALAAVPRFPFVFRPWNYEVGAFVYRNQADAAGDDPSDSYESYGRMETEGEDYELEAQHSTYSVAEDEAAIKIQAPARGWLARRLVAKLQRAQRRQRRRDALEREWEATRQERAQLLTLTMGVSVGADARVQSWWQARRRQSQARQQPQPTRSRQPVAPSSSSRGRRDRDAASSPSADSETDETMRAQVARVEHAYHRSARSEHRRDWNFPAAARAPDAHGRSILELLRAYEAFQRATAPRGCVSRLSLRHTKAATCFGWQEVCQSGVRYFFHAESGATSWAPPPEYSFEENAAATTIQAFARQMAALRVRERELSESSFVAVVGAAVDRVVRLGGWTGFGLEGLTPGAALCLVGLAKHLPPLSSSVLAKVATADDLRAVPAELLRKELQWSVDDVAALQLLPEIDHRVKPPLSPKWKTSPPSPTPALPPSSPGWWPSALQFLPSTRVVSQLVAKRFPNQQGRVQTLVRAVAASTTPVSYRQLEMHLRKYGGRPDEAASAATMRELADLAPLARTAKQERGAFYTLARALDRAIVLAANLDLSGLHRELSAVRVAVWELVELASGGEDGEDAAVRAFRRVETALPLSSSLSAPELAREKTRALTREPVKGMWEHAVRAKDDAQPSLSPAQAARYVRECALERVLAWERATRLCQSLVRMAPVRRRFLAWQRTRQEAARTLQRVYRGHEGRELAARLAAQRASDFVQARDPRSGAFYYVFSPTRERFVDEPVDASGRAVPFRPLVRDRVTQRWLLAWPHFDKSKRKAGAPGGGNDGEDGAGAAVSCSVCRVARAARRCNECASPAGDFLDLCLACFADAHASDSPAAGHAFLALARAAAACFRCVECRRPSTRRCLACDEHYCARCFHRVHARGNRRASHRSEVYAERRCLVCQDALCEPCLVRSHGISNANADRKRAGRSAHATERLVQPLEDPEREAHCAQCQARRGDARCPFCAALLCAVCLEERRKAHAEALACPETALELARACWAGTRCAPSAASPPTASAPRAATGTAACAGWATPGASSGSTPRAGARSTSGASGAARWTTSETRPARWPSWPPSRSRCAPSGERTRAPRSSRPPRSELTRRLAMAGRARRRWPGSGR